MASYPVTVYRWDDPGAPQLSNGNISSFFEVLQKCLVDGYGTKTPLGWTRSYYDPITFKSAWRNNVSAGGSGGSVYFYSNTETNNNTTVIRATNCKNIDETGAIFGRGKLSAMSYATGVTRWVIIGTAIGFYFYNFGTDNFTNNVVSMSAGGFSGQRISFYAGDLFSTVPNDAGRFLLVMDLLNAGDNATGGGAQNIGQMSHFQFDSSRILVWDADNNQSSVSYGFAAGLNTGTTNPSITSTVAFQRVFPLLLTPVLISLSTAANLDRNGDFVNVSLSRPYIRGIVPGIFCAQFYVANTQELPYVISENTDQYHALQTAGVNLASNMVIKSSGDWHDPFI
ncbi:hypothetical protein [Alishewanella sp. HL-SH06]|uniref:hypothetical protein n=1 Tax=Alishewanella sp. HL-SH06 TaxID=3461144 RepID=UPI004043788A